MPKYPTYKHKDAGRKLAMRRKAGERCYRAEKALIKP